MHGDHGAVVLRLEGEHRLERRPPVHVDQGRSVRGEEDGDAIVAVSGVCEDGVDLGIVLHPPDHGEAVEVDGEAVSAGLKVGDRRHHDHLAVVVEVLPLHACVPQR